MGPCAPNLIRRPKNPLRRRGISNPLQRTQGKVKLGGKGENDQVMEKTDLGQSTSRVQRRQTGEGTRS